MTRVRGFLLRHHPFRLHFFHLISFRAFRFASCGAAGDFSVAHYCRRKSAARGLIRRFAFAIAFVFGRKPSICLIVTHISLAPDCFQLFFVYDNFASDSRGVEGGERADRAWDYARARNGMKQRVVNANGNRPRRKNVLLL